MNATEIFTTAEIKTRDWISNKYSKSNFSYSYRCLNLILWLKSINYHLLLWFIWQNQC